MAAGWTVVYESDVPAPSYGPTAGKSLLYYHHQIDELARHLGLTPLSAFFSRNPQDIIRYMQDLGVEPDPAMLPDEEWFDPSEGLVTVRGLLVQLRADVGDIPEPARVISDLEMIEKALLIAVDRGVRFHLGRALHLPERE